MDRKLHDHETLSVLPERWLLLMDYLHEIRVLIQGSQELLIENRELLKQILAAVSKNKGK